MAARIAYEVKTEFEKEAAAKAAAKQALVAFLAGNEEHKKIKEAEKERQRKEDLDYMRQYEEILDKQQKERLARLEKLKVWQVRHHLICLAILMLTHSNYTWCDQEFGDSAGCNH